jgi:hypothetical protein
MSQDLSTSAASDRAGPQGGRPSEVRLYQPDRNGTPADPPLRPEDLISPGLAPRNGGLPAYELKFLIDDGLARAVRQWAAHRLTIDPHADPHLGDAYRITSHYFDTPGLDVFHRNPPFKRRKYRLRRYGREDVVYLERKAKSKDRVRKKRAQVTRPELDLLAGAAVDPSWPGAWFHRQVKECGLRPVCQVNYQRVAYVGRTADGPVRLTIDRDVVCRPSETWALDELPDGRPILTGQNILEVKYRGSLPALFKQLLLEFGLRPAGVSKYRLGVQAWGLDTASSGG